MSVYITDYVSTPDIESKILSGKITKKKEDALIILVWHKKIDSDYLSQFPKLLGVIRYGVGIDNIDPEAIKERGIYFCNTPDYGTDEVSDTVIAMIMNMTRGITSYDAFSKRNTLDSWQENTLGHLRRTSKMKLGVIGAGRIGGSVLIKAKGIGFKTAFYDLYKERGYEKMLGSQRYDTAEELITNSDIISVNTPLTSKTKSMVNKEFIERMKKGSYFVNSSRGEIVEDLDFFYEPLKNRNLMGVALDVLPEEPPKDGKLIKCWRSNDEWLQGRLLINPHTSYFSREAFVEMREKAALNARRILENQKPFNIIFDGKK